MTTPLENSTPGFAIFKRSGTNSFRAVSPLDPAESRSNMAFEPTGGTLDALADDLVNLELDLDDIADAGYLDPVVADAIKQDLAAAGAGVIEARYEGATEAGDGLTDAMQRIIARLETELSDAKRQNRTDEAHIDWLQERVSELSEQLTASKGEAALTRERVSHLEGHVFKLEQELEAAANGLTGLRLEEVQELREQTQDFQLALRDLRFRLLAQHREMESMRDDNDLLRAQLSDTEALLRATHRELVRTRTELTTVQSQVVTIAEDLQEAEAENAVMEGWMNDALSRYASLQTELVDATTLCAQLGSGETTH